MAKVIALHTIHRTGKRKGEQEVIAPNTEFESSGTELEGLKKQGAVKVLDDKPAAKATKPAAKKAEEPAKAPAKDGDDGLGDL